MFTLYGSDYIGSPGNCLYPHRFEITDADSLKDAVRHDYVCAEYKNSYRNGANYLSADCLPVDCDNDHSEDPALWVTPEDVAANFPGVRFAVHYSRHHMKEKNGTAARPKFHVLFPIDSITDADAYSDLKKLVNTIFPSVTTGFLNTSGSITFTGKVCDSRGRWSDEATVTINVVAYAAPRFNSYSTQRCTSAGASSSNGTYAKSTVNYSYWSCSGKNTITYNNYTPPNYAWKPLQTVLFIYDGTYYVAFTLSYATTGYYGITKLSNSTASTSTTLAATANAVKLAYDRNSWDSITLTNALAIAYGGTGATSAAGARTNLGIGVTLLYSGTMTTGSASFAYGAYNFYVIIGQPSSSGSRTPIVVPKAALTTGSVAYQITDESYYYSFNLYYSGSTVYMSYKGRNSSGQIIAVYGVN